MKVILLQNKNYLNNFYLNNKRYYSIFFSYFHFENNFIKLFCFESFFLIDYSQYNLINLELYRTEKLWKYENVRLNNLAKEQICGFYEQNSFDIYLKYLGHYFKFPIKYEVILSLTMKIKGFLWTYPRTWSPIIYNYVPLMELRSLERRAYDLLKWKLNYQSWKGWIRIKIIPKLAYRNWFIYY